MHLPCYLLWVVPCTAAIFTLSLTIQILVPVAALTFIAVARLHCCRCLHQHQERHPDVQAVASGAIASDYQRLRVESVSVFSTRITWLADGS
jgi:hypothetical protein